MKKVFNYLDSINFNQYFILLIILGYFPIFFFGYFVQDDMGLVAGLSNLNFRDAANAICQVNNNRPLSCIFHATLTRLPSVYQFYFSINLLFYILFILNTLKIFDFIIDNIFLKKTFVIFLIFPFFSYTILYSPAMQSMGTFALLLWSISLIFLKKFIKNNKKFNLIFSYIFLLLTFLVYESAFPLLGVSFFFPLYFSGRFRLFLFNFLAILFIIGIIIFIQKFLIPKIYNIDLSRIKIDFYNYKKISFLIIINLLLTLNILFFSFELFIKVLFDSIYNFNYLFLLQIFLILVIFYSLVSQEKLYINNKNKDKKIIKVSLLIFLSVIFLNSIMHTLANTGLDFIQYNNRALVSLSFIFAFVVIFILKVISLKRKFLFNFIFTVIFLVFISNFFYFQNNLIKEKFLAVSINKIINIQHTNNKKEVFFLVSTKKPDIQELLSYGSFDYFHYLNLNMVDFLSGTKVVIYLTEKKFCNKFYYNEYIRDPFIKNYYINLYVFDVISENPKLVYANITFEESENKINSILKCDYKLTMNLAPIREKTYIGQNYRSFFINSLYRILY